MCCTRCGEYASSCCGSDAARGCLARVVRTPVRCLHNAPDQRQKTPKAVLRRTRPGLLQTGASHSLKPFACFCFSLLNSVVAGVVPFDVVVFAIRPNDGRGATPT